MDRIVPDGALIDSRPIEAKQKDYRADDFMVAGAEAVFDNPKPLALGATLYNQWYTSSCVPHGISTALEYEGILPQGGISQLRAYRRRANFANPGSGAVDIFDIIRAGQTPNKDAPIITGMREDQANAEPVVVGQKLIADFKYYGFNDLGLAPAAVSAGKAVPIFIYATEEEWSQEYVTIRTPNLNILDAYVRHCVCMIPKGDFMENGQPWLSVHDSAGFGGRHLRYARLDFYQKRAYYAAQVFKSSELPTIPVFTYTFTKQLKYQDPRNDPAELRALQKALQYLKRSNGQTYMAVGVFGPFGPKTKEALGLFQTDKHIKDPAGQGTNFGPKTRTAMNAALQ